MWAKYYSYPDDHTIKLTLQYQQKAVSFRQLLDAWRDDEYFCAFFSSLLASLPMPAFFWEMPALCSSMLEQPFECVFVDSPDLVMVDPEPLHFQAYYAGAHNRIADFENLGGDALLVVPEPLDACSAYAHIADFSRSAPLKQQCALWRRVGELCHQHIGVIPLWLNTSGLGVFWLHIRLDKAPKYYTYLPYKILS